MSEPARHGLITAQKVLAGAMAAAGFVVPSTDHNEQWMAAQEEAASILGTMLAAGVVVIPDEASRADPDPTSQNSYARATSLRAAVIGAVENHLRTGCEDTPPADCAIAIWLDVESRGVHQFREGEIMTLHERFATVLRMHFATDDPGSMAAIAIRETVDLTDEDFDLVAGELVGIVHEPPWRAPVVPLTTLADDYSVRLPWLIERGQSEHHVPTVWWTGLGWEQDANLALLFDTEEAADRYIERHSPIPSHRPRFGRAVQHGWLG